jgi:N6-adenosine-specific RNA methylase IME4
MGDGDVEPLFDSDAPFIGPGGPFGTIVADPPWQYRPTAHTTTAMPDERFRSAEDQYPTMTMRQIADLPVATVAADDAHLYLWTTAPRLVGDRNDSTITPFDILDAWGFRYVTTLVWHKTGGPGMGWYWRGDAEFILFGVRGKCPIPPALRRSNVFVAPKSRHSQKPESIMDAIEVVSPGPRVEMFARRARLGWHSWGNQVGSVVS